MIDYQGLRKADFINFILLFIPSTLPVEIRQSYQARIPVLLAIMVAAFFISM